MIKQHTEAASYLSMATTLIAPIAYWTLAKMFDGGYRYGLTAAGGLAVAAIALALYGLKDIDKTVRMIFAISLSLSLAILLLVLFFSFFAVCNCALRPDAKIF